MRKKDTAQASKLKAGLLAFSGNQRVLPGIDDIACMAAFIEQLLESIRRVRYVQIIRDKSHSDLRADPKSELFDPLKAAAIHRKRGDIEEACWLVFLATHFGKNLKTGWLLAQDTYGALGIGNNWTWDEVSSDPMAMSDWININYQTLCDDGKLRHFGNHRKYETLKPTEKGTGRVIVSYVNWILQSGSHTKLFAAAQNGRSPRDAFRYLYESMDVFRFGRTAKFDYLTMIGKLGLAIIDPDSPYLTGATGPLSGAKLLFEGSKNARIPTNELETLVIGLADFLGLGMQDMEDALCNWQKSPDRFIAFRG